MYAIQYTESECHIHVKSLQHTLTTQVVTLGEIENYITFNYIQTLD